MLDAGEQALATRAGHLQGLIGAGSDVIRAAGRVGGGALPMYELEGPAVALAADLDPVAAMAALRGSDPPVIARIHDGRVLLDPRTLRDEDLEAVAAAARRALSR